MAEKTRVLLVSGSNRAGSHSLMMLTIAQKAVEDAGGEAQLLDLAQVPLPLLRPGDHAMRDDPNVQKVKKLALWADAFIIATPEYHGGPSATIKNWFDHLYQEFAGKVAAVLAATGGGQGDQSVGQMEVHSRMCHMWTLPYICHAGKADFEHGELTNHRTLDRLARMGRDVVRYGALFRDAFATDRVLGHGVESGFAGFHVAK